MEIVNVDPAILIASEYNPRKMSANDDAELRKSIEKFGLIDPIIVNGSEKRKNIIVGGHQRHRIATIMGMPTVPVIYLNLDLEYERELNLRLNRNLGQFDWDLLANFSGDELKNAGFTGEELNRFFDLHEDEIDADAEYHNASGEHIHKGDVFELGRHRLMCGDSSSDENVRMLMNGALADMVFTDPPYNVNYDYTVTFVEGRKRKELFHAFDDNKSDPDFIELIRKVFEVAKGATKDDAPFYCWHASKTDWLFRQGIEKAGWKISLTLYWIKNNCTYTRGLDFFWALEPCFYGWKADKTHYVNKKIEGDMKNIIQTEFHEFEDMPNVWYSSRDKIKDYGHPTQKPVRLAQKAFKKSARESVLDLFGGSGTTLIAAEQAGLKCFMMELDPKYCEVIINRWEKKTGQKAIKIT